MRKPATDPWVVYPELGWAAPPAQPPAPAHGVHVWRVDLALPAAQVARFGATLAADEEARAARFRFARDRRHFVVARGALRAILGRYLGAAPETLAFGYGAYGKPALAGPAAATAIAFNLAHSHELALLAVTRGRAVGVDIEYIRPEVAGERLAEQFFSAGEAATLRALPAAAQPEAFFACWTRKEAYLKARGEGLALALGDFDVTVGPGAPVALLRARGEPAEAARWTLAALAPGPRYAGALAVEGPLGRLACWAWAPPRG